MNESLYYLILHVYITYYTHDIENLLRMALRKNLTNTHKSARRQREIRKCRLHPPHLLQNLLLALTLARTTRVTLYRPTVYNPDGTERVFVRKAVQRRTIDYTANNLIASANRAFIASVAKNPFKDEAFVKPTSGSMLDFDPSWNLKHQPASSFALKFVHVSANKIKTPINKGTRVKRNAGAHTHDNTRVCACAPHVYAFVCSSVVAVVLSYIYIHIYISFPTKSVR